jgi:hypothetical protein
VRRDRFGEVIEEPETPAVTPKARALARLAALRRELGLVGHVRTTPDDRSGRPSHDSTRSATGGTS